MNRLNLKWLVLISIVWVLMACNVPPKTEISSKLEFLPFAEVSVTDNFLKPKIDTALQVTVPQILKFRHPRPMFDVGTLVGTYVRTTVFSFQCCDGLMQGIMFHSHHQVNQCPTFICAAVYPQIFCCFVASEVIVHVI